MLCMSYNCSVAQYCVVVTLLSGAVLTDDITQTLFRVAKGYKLFGGTLLKRTNLKSITSTICSVLCSSGCGSANYSAKLKVCETFVERFYNCSVVWSQDPDWQVLYRDEPVRHGDWTLVFRAQSGINIPLYNVWTSAGQHDDSPLSSGVLNGCYRLDNLGDCKRHFRSSILDNWSNITQVKFSVYVNGSEINHIIFNGSSTTKDSWFRQSNILSSSWRSIKNDSNIYKFNLSGYDDYSMSRRFLIRGQYGSCSDEEIYFVALDKLDACDKYWAINTTHFPVFVYSKMDRMARLGHILTDYSVADVMAVFVKL